MVYLHTGETGQVDWTINVPETGLYNLSAIYFPVEGKSSAIERALYIDATSFSEAAYLQFDRVWANEKDVVDRTTKAMTFARDKWSNHAGWKKRFRTPTGTNRAPFKFYFKKGNTR